MGGNVITKSTPVTHFWYRPYEPTKRSISSTVTNVHSSGSSIVSMSSGSAGRRKWIPDIFFNEALFHVQFFTPTHTVCPLMYDKFKPTVIQNNSGIPDETIFSSQKLFFFYFDHVIIVIIISMCLCRGFRSFASEKTTAHHESCHLPIFPHKVWVDPRSRFSNTFPSVRRGFTMVQDDFLYFWIL